MKTSNNVESGQIVIVKTKQDPNRVVTVKQIFPYQVIPLLPQTKARCQVLCFNGGKRLTVVSSFIPEVGGNPTYTTSGGQVTSEGTNKFYFTIEEDEKELYHMYQIRRR
jgi:hypothetical protein